IGIITDRRGFSTKGRLDPRDHRKPEGLFASQPQPDTVFGPAIHSGITVVPNLPLATWATRTDSHILPLRRPVVSYLLPMEALVPWAQAAGVAALGAAGVGAGLWISRRPWWPLACVAAMALVAAFGAGR